MRRQTLVLAAAASTAALALAIAPISGATAAPANTCHIPLSAGDAVITRTTGHIGRGWYWTSITESTTGNGWRPIVNRGIVYGTKGAMTRLEHGTTGVITATQSWGFRSRTNRRVVVRVTLVDVNTGLYGSKTC